MFSCLSHIPYDTAITALKAFENKAKQQDLVFSTTPLEGESVYFKADIQDETEIPLSFSRYNEPPSSVNSDKAGEVW